VIKANGANLKNEVGQRYTAMVDEFSKLAKKRHELLKLSQQDPELYKLKQAEFDKEINQNLKNAGINPNKGSKKMRDEDLIGKSRFNIGVLKPNIEYLMNGQSEETDLGGHDLLNHSIKVPGPEVLDRYMARSHFGKWYVAPDQWQQLQ
jgi:hypothetical protein